jgi:hypothetical protein
MDLGFFLCATSVPSVDLVFFSVRVNHGGTEDTEVAERNPNYDTTE